MKVEFLRPSIRIGFAFGLALCACSSSFTTYKGANAFNWPRKEIPKIQSESIEQLLDKEGRVKAVVIIRNGCLIFEKYHVGINFDEAWNVKSASKSIVSILAGIALDQGLLDTNASLEKVLGSSGASTPLVLDLLRMTGGYPESSHKFYWITKTSGHPIEASLDTRIRSIPADSTIYSTIGVNLLGYSIAKAANQTLMEFGESRLFAPLGIKPAYWPTDRIGNNISGADFFMTARDFGRIGFLMLEGGIINGNKIVSDKWIKASTLPRVKIRDTDYGYLWWIDSEIMSNNFYAAGYRGQILYVSPESNSVVVIFAEYDNYKESLAMARRLTEIVTTE